MFHTLDVCGTYTLFGTVWMCEEPRWDDSYMFHTVWTCAEPCSGDLFTFRIVLTCGVSSLGDIHGFILFVRLGNLVGAIYDVWTCGNLVWTIHKCFTPVGRLG